jgi:hypothetical protein
LNEVYHSDNSVHLRISFDKKEIEMFTNRLFTTLIMVALAAVVGLTVRQVVFTSAAGSRLEEAQRLKQNQDADTVRWEAMGEYYARQAQAQRLKEAQPYIMDSATRSYIAWGQAMQVRNTIDSGTRSYIAWGEALEAAGKLGESGACPTTSQENIFAGIPNNLDSATRSYIVWGLALQAKNDMILEPCVASSPP